MVQFHQRARQVETDTRAYIHVVHGRSSLVEAFKDLLHLISGNTLARILDAQASLFLVVFQFDLHLSSRGRELKGVRQQVHHHLVEVLAVDPYRQPVGVVHIAQFDVLAPRLHLEERVQVLHERHEVGLAHPHPHLSLLDLPQVHHLVNQVQYALRIALHGLIHPVPVRVGILFDERHDRCEYQCHRCSYLMTDIHEEPQLRLAHLLCMDMLLQSEVRLFLSAAVGKIHIQSQGNEHEVQQSCPCREIPHRVNLHGKLLDFRFRVADNRLHAEPVCSRRHVTECEFMCSRWHGNPRFPVDAVFVGDMVGVVESQCREVQRERVVLMSQFKAVGVDHRAVGDNKPSRFLSCPHIDAVDAHTCDVYGEFPFDRV